MNYSGFSSKNSIIHKMNPSLKFLTTAFVIAMIFIPFGFVYQAILLVFCLSLYFLAKLPLKKLWRIVQSIIVLAIILSLINWVTYKGPGVVFDFTNSHNFFYKPGFLNWNSSHVVKYGDKYFLQGSMYGGQVVTSLNFPPISIDKVGVLNVNDIGSGFYSITSSSKFDATNINKVLTEMDKIIKNSGIANGWNIKNYYSLQDNTLYIYFYLTKWYTYSSYAITLMLFVSIKIFLMILIVTILTSTTSSIQLTCALEDILNPLKILKLPITEWSMTIALCLRFIPTLLDESNRILKAQASRGLDFKNGSIKDKVFSLSSLVVPLFSIAFKKAGELSNAMEARGYNPRRSRTRYRDYDIRFVDWVVFSFSAFLLGVLICLISISSKNLFISFGFWDIFAY